VNGGVTNLLTGAQRSTAEEPGAKRLRKAEANKRGKKKKVPAARVRERYLHPRQTDEKRAG